MIRERFYLSTIDPNAPQVAAQNGLGLEIAEYCTAWNLDERFAQTDEAVRRACAGISRRVLHGPFNELFPCAIDPKARELARLRYIQALDVARHYGADRVILHGGYNPWIYYHSWYVEQSAAFWRAFPIPEGMTVCLENVMEQTPELLLEIVSRAENPGLSLCLDVGHVNAYSQVPVGRWLEAWAGTVKHFHIHNNYADRDSHNPPDQGTIAMEPLLRQALALCPEATFTLEVTQGAEAAAWLNTHIFEEE